jgi:hypothetical protein
MKRFMTIVSVLAVCAIATNAFATTDHQFGWTISTSSTNANIHYSAAPVGGPGTLYLWLQCSSNVTGAAASEWAMVTTGMFWGGIAGVAPYLFTGPQTDLLGAFGNVNPVTMVGIITVFDFSGGSICFGPSQANNRNITVGVDGKGYDNDWRGCHTATFPPPACEGALDGVLCNITAVETETWGNIKSLYR